MRLRNAWLLRILVAALLLSSALMTRLAHAEKTGSPPALTPEYAEATIRMIYDRFTQQARDSGEDVKISLSGFQTIWPEEFDEHYWVELVTMPGGWTLNAGVTTFVDDVGGAGQEFGMKLDPRWWEAEDWLALPGNEAMHELTYAYVLQNGDLRDVQTVLALTTFSLEVELKGRIRTYQAAAEWLESDGEDARVRIQDNVNPEIAIAVTTNVEIMPEHPAFSSSPPDLRSPGNSALTCAKTSLTETQTQVAFDFTGHSSGRHQSDVTHQFKCSCGTTCVSRCEVQQTARYCGDTGQVQGVLRCHRPYQGIRTQGSTSSVEGAQCASLMACYFQDCALCQCGGLVINITGGVAGFKSTVTGASFWHHEGAWNMQCPDCSPIVEPPPPTPTPDLPCHDPVPQLHAGPVIGRMPLGGEALFSNFPLDRFERLGDRHYLMEEWAILDVEHDAAGTLVSVEVTAASSSAYGDHQRRSFVDNFTSKRGTSSSPPGAVAGRSVLLVIHHPNHPHNERWIPRPGARLAAGPLSAEAPEGRAVVRADFAEDRTLSALEVLYSDRPLTLQETAYLESNLGLVYANDDRHRVVLYGVVQLGGGTIGLESYMPIPSMCCCPIDWPNCNGGGGPQI